MKVDVLPEIAIALMDLQKPGANELGTATAIVKKSVCQCNDYSLCGLDQWSVFHYPQRKRWSVKIHFLIALFNLINFFPNTICTSRKQCTVSLLNLFLSTSSLHCKFHLFGSFLVFYQRNRFKRRKNECTQR